MQSPDQGASLKNYSLIGRSHSRSHLRPLTADRSPLEPFVFRTVRLWNLLEALDLLNLVLARNRRRLELQSELQSE